MHGTKFHTKMEKETLRKKKSKAREPDHGAAGQYCEGDTLELVKRSAKEKDRGKEVPRARQQQR